MFVLTGGGDLVAVFNDTPSEHCDGESHGKAKLDMITGVVISTNKIYLKNL